MTPAELSREWDYRYAKRIGIIRDDGEKPTHEQIQRAAMETDKEIEKLCGNQS